MEARITLASRWPWLNPTTAALVAFCLMMLVGVLSWRDVLGYTDAWRVLVWFATLVALADGLQRVGFLAWFAAHVTAGLSPLPVTTRLVLRCSSPPTTCSRA